MLREAYACVIWLWLFYYSSMLLHGAEYANSKQKRTLDILVAAPMLVPTGIGLLAVKFALRKSGEPTLYRQERIGLNESPFEILKLHTLADDTELPLFTGADIIRRLGLDELPQAWNVLRGHMSIRGRRPIVPGEHEEVMDSIGPKLQQKWQEVVDLERPGIVNSYGIYHHIHPEQSPNEIEIRAEMDIKDFQDGSILYDSSMVIELLHTAISRRLA